MGCAYYFDFCRLCRNSAPHLAETLPFPILLLVWFGVVKFSLPSVLFRVLERRDHLLVLASPEARSRTSNASVAHCHGRSLYCEWN